MPRGLGDILADGGTRKVQRNGEFTLPKEWREKHGIRPHDKIAYHVAEDGTLEVIPPDD